MYAKSKSNVVAKLDGTFKIPTTATNQAAEMTVLQQSIFNAPVPGSAAAPPPAAPSGLPSKPQTATGTGTADAQESRGQKRARDEEEEEDDDDSDVAMEEDSDDD